MNFANLVLTQFWMSFCFCIQMNPWQSHSDENANIEKYIKDQFLENCFGSDTIKLMGDREAHARSYCSKEILKTTARPPSPFTSSTRPTTATSTTVTSTTTTYTSTTLRTTTATKRTTTRWSWMSPSLQGLQYPVFPSLPLINQLQYYPSPFQNQVLGEARPRGQRSVSVTSKVDDLKSKMTLKIKEMKCFLTKLGVLDTDGLITRETLLNEFKDSIEEVLLRKDLSDAIIKCEEKSKCLSGMGASDRSHLSQALDFYKCYEEAKTEACVRKNIRTKVTQQLRSIIRQQNDIFVKPCLFLFLGKICLYNKSRKHCPPLGAPYSTAAILILCLPSPQRRWTRMTSPSRR